MNERQVDRALEVAEKSLKTLEKGLGLLDKWLASKQQPRMVTPAPRAQQEKWNLQH